MKRGSLFIKCQILGVDSFSFIEKLHKIGVFAYDITFFEGKTVFSIDFTDRKKLFAISRNMCYNIRILKYYGRVSLVKKAFSRLGLIICFLIFFVLANVFDGWVSQISYVGDGEYFEPQISAILQKEGIKTNSFLSVDLRKTESVLLQSVDGISYASLKKSGRILTVEVYKAEQKVEEIDYKKPQIAAPVGGKIRAINLLSGTACVSVGDEVLKGDVLIDGYFLKGEEKLKTYALGEVEIEVEFVYVYQSFASGEKYKNRGLLLAEMELGEQDVISREIKEQTKNGKTVYTVTLVYVVTVS